MQFRKGLGAALGALLLPLASPALAGAAASDVPALGTPSAAVAEAADTYVAIPVLRQSETGPVPFLYVIRPAAFGLSVTDLRNGGLTVVPEHVSVWDVADRAIDIDTVARRIADLAGAKRTAAGASAADAESASVAAMSTLSNVPIAIYSDTSNTAIGHTIARNAWNDAKSILGSDAGITFDVLIQQDNATAYPPGQPAVSNVTTECDLQRFSEYEESLARAVKAQSVLVFSDGTIRPFGLTTDHYGLALENVSNRWGRGSSRDACRSVPGGAEYRRSPAYVPVAFSSTAAWTLGAGTEKQAPSHWAAHEVAHMFTMNHDMAECTWVGFRMHKTLEAATSDQPDHCPANNAQTYQVYRFSADGKAAISAENTRRSNCISAGWCTSNATPSAPRSISAQVEDGAITLSWQAPLHNGGSAVAGYCIFRSSTDRFLEGPGTDSVCPNLGSPPATTYRWPGLTNGQTSYFYVRAYNSNDDPRTPWASHPYDRDGPGSDYIGAAPGAAPGAPTLQPITFGNQQLTLSWTPNANNGGYPVIGYKVYRTCSVCTPTSFNTSSTTWTDTGLSNGQVYYYRVTALNARGESPQSNEQWNYPRTVPVAPSLDSATPDDNKVTLAWTPNTNNGGSAVSGYKVYRATSSTGTRTQLLSGGCGNNVVTTSCIDNTAVNGTTYWYDVRSVNNAGTSAASNVRSATPTAPPSTTPSFSEDWSSGISGWTVAGSGATSDCAVGQSGCSLKLNPPAGSAGVQVSKSMNVTMGSPTTVSFWFRGDKTYGDTDSNVQVMFNGGTNTTLQITEPSSNNGVALYGTNSSGAFTSWPNANAWYQAVITINPSTDTAMAQIKDASGNAVGGTGSVSIASAATTITGLSYNAWFWGGTAAVFHYDTVRVTGGVTSGFTESWNSGIGSWSVAGSGATSDCSIAQNGCSLKLNPPAGSAGVQVSKSLSHTMASPTTVSYWFRGDKTYGDTDSNVQVLFNGGTNVTLQITEPSSNNGVALYGTNSTGNMFTWTENTWYQAVITINPSTDTAFVQIKNSSGSVLATSGNVGISSTATTITGLSFNAWFWGGTADVFHYDTVAIT